MKWWLRRGWPLLLGPLVLVTFSYGFGIETSQRFVASISLSLLAWAVVESLRFARRDRRLGSVLVKLPRSGLPAVAHGTLAVLFSAAIGLEVYTWLAYGHRGPWIPWQVGLWIAIVFQNLMLARAGLEIREGGLCNALSEWRWDELRHWRWQGSNLQLHFGFWSPAGFPIPEDRRADVDTALTRHASAKP